MNATRKVKLGDINANLTCKLCMGYLVEATTIIECLHSFCKSCIIKYLEKSADLEEKYFCPICEIQLHETKPLTSIRSDLMLQEIVYKLVPGLFKNEMSRRREFYEKSDSTPTNQLDSGQVFDELYITSDDLIHLSLEYVTNDINLRESTRRYLKCPAAVSVCILKKFIQGKYDLEPGTNVDIMFGDRILPDDFLLMDVAYKYSWTMNGSKPLTLSYRIKGQMKPIIKPERTINDVMSPPEPVKLSQPPQSQKKKVCNENGSNIMPPTEVKNNPIKIPKNGIISSTGEVTIAPLKPPNLKTKNRKRKHLNYTDIVIEIKDDMKSIAKRLKLPKETKSQPTSPYQSSAATVEIIPTKETKSGESGEGKEVQLQISENGVMSARSVTLGGNGDEQIILNLTASPSASTSKSTPSPTSSTINPAEKLLLSGNFHSKTGPSGVTEIICDKKPDPITNGMKSITPKPGYVTLNIPNPTGSIFASGQCNPSPTNQIDKTKKIPVTNLHDSSPSSSSSFSPNAIRTKSPIEIKVSDKPSNKSLLEKIRNRIAAKGKDGENVIQAISDLGKLCNTTSLPNSSTSTVNNGISKSSGVHTHPIISTLNSHHLHPPTKNNKAANNNFPFSLNFPPSSGMSVSMIPCTTNASTTGNNNTNYDNINSTTCSQSTTPPKRISSHQTTVVNGDLKFTTSPKQPIALNGDREHPLKKPPKFFKSRHATSPVTQKSCSPQRPEIEIKRKTPIHMGNGSLEPPKKKSKERNDSSKANLNGQSVSIASSKGTQSSINFSTVTTTNGGESQRPIPFPSQSNESLFAQQIKAMNGMQTEAFNSSFGLAAAAAVAAAAANGNGVRSFLPEGYPAMPYGYGNILSQLMVPQFYNPLNFSGAVSSPVAASLNLTKPKGNSPPLPSSTTSTPSPGGSNSKILNGLLGTSDAKVDSDASTLDLSVGKNGKGKEEDNDKHPLLSRLLDSKDQQEKSSRKKSLSPCPKANGNGKDQESKGRSVSPPQSESGKKSMNKNGEPGRVSSSHNGHAHDNGHTSGTPTNTTTNGEAQKPLENSVSSTLQKLNEPENIQKEKVEAKDTSSSDASTLKDKDILSPSASDKIISQNNNNNHSPDKDSGDSLSGAAENEKIKKSLDCANKISNTEGKGNCNGNNNVVPAHSNTEVGSNPGSA